MKSLLKSVFKHKPALVMLSVITVIIVFILLLALTLLIVSPGKVIPLTDNEGKPLEGSISEKVFIPINGVRQGMFIKSRHSGNPVLLYLHGGMPDYFLTKKYPTGLEEIFTVVWWEQRGSGMSYSPDIPPHSLNLDQMVSDTKELTDYLRKRFGQEKIYLMGHSGGTFIGIQAAARYPELYHAYIGVAQMANQLRSEILAYNYMVSEFREKGNSGMLRKLEAAPVTHATGVPDAYRRLRDPAMHSLGIGTTRDMNSVISGIFFPSLKCKEYTLKEKVNMWLGKSRSGISVMWNEMINTDLSEKVTELKIPVYLFEGIYDYTCSYSEAKAYFDKLNAPVKGFYTFEQSAHSPLFEEADKTRAILQNDVLRGLNTLADSK